MQAEVVSNDAPLLPKIPPLIPPVQVSQTIVSGDTMPDMFLPDISQSIFTVSNLEIDLNPINSPAGTLAIKVFDPATKHLIDTVTISEISTERRDDLIHELMHLPLSRHEANVFVAPDAFEGLLLRFSKSGAVIRSNYAPFLNDLAEKYLTYIESLHPETTEVRILEINPISVSKDGNRDNLQWSWTDLSTALPPDFTGAKPIEELFKLSRVQPPVSLGTDESLFLDLRLFSPNLKDQSKIAESKLLMWISDGKLVTAHEGVNLDLNRLWSQQSNPNGPKKVLLQAVVFLLSRVSLNSQTIVGSLEERVNSLATSFEKTGSLEPEFIRKQLPALYHSLSTVGRSLSLFHDSISMLQVNSADPHTVFFQSPLIPQSVPNQLSIIKGDIASFQLRISQAIESLNNIKQGYQTLLQIDSSKAEVRAASLQVILIPMAIGLGVAQLGNLLWSSQTFYSVLCGVGATLVLWGIAAVKKWF